MSYLINDELIWICTPKCASVSIERALKNSNLKIEPFVDSTTTNGNLIVEKHLHVPVIQSLHRFGKKETICITRNWFSKWLSALNQVWKQSKKAPIEYRPTFEWEDIDNNFIYETFDDKFINDLHNINKENIINCYGKLIKKDLSSFLLDDDEICEMEYMSDMGVILILQSNKSLTDGQKCTYEFDINEIDKFTNFIEDRFGERLIIDTYNKSSDTPSKIIINDELKQWVWDKFEKRFDKRNQLI
jgi:hypothetical protein